MRFVGCSATLAFALIPSFGCARILDIDSIPYAAPDSGSVEDAAAEPEVLSPSVDAPHDEGATVADDAIDASNDAKDAPVDVATCNPNFLSSDGHNCGRCGHDCLGAECKNGVCQPIFLLTSLAHATSIVAADNHLYWVDDGAGTVSRADKELPTVAVTLVSTTLPAFDLAVDATYVYYSAYADSSDPSGGVNRIRKDRAGGVVNLSTGFSGVSRIAITDSFVFYAANNSGAELIRSPKDQPGADVLYAIGPSPPDAGEADPHFFAIAVDDSYVYATDTGKEFLYRELQNPRQGDFAERIARTDARPLAVQVDADYIYWGDHTNLYRTARLSPFNAPDMLALASVTAIAVDATDIYFATIQFGAGIRAGISRIPKFGFSPPEEITSGWGSIEGLTLDAKAIYFTTGDKIVKLAK
jgi:hypothetical protein